MLKKETAAKLEKGNQDRLKAQMEIMIKESKEDRKIEKAEREEINNFMATEPVKAVFQKYDRHLRHMFKFYASMDSKKDNTFDLDYLHSMLSMREFLKFGYQQKLTPTFIMPDELVQIYKGMLGDSVSQAEGKEDRLSVANRASGMVDFEQFKKAVVHISVIA